MWRHFGARVVPGDLPVLRDTRGRASFALDRDIGLPVVPPAGLGWFGPAVVRLLAQDGSPSLFAPTRFELAAEGGKLRVVSIDDAAHVRHELAIEALDGGAFRFVSALTNEGNTPVGVTALASAQVPLPATSAGIVSWRGRHNGELVECREAMPQQRWERAVRRGISGHGGPPGVEEACGAKQFYAFDPDADFAVPDGVGEHFSVHFGLRGSGPHEVWQASLAAYRM